MKTFNLILPRRFPKETGMTTPTNYGKQFSDGKKLHQIVSPYTHGHKVRTAFESRADLLLTTAIPTGEKRFIYAELSRIPAEYGWGYQTLWPTKEEGSGVLIFTAGPEPAIRHAISIHELARNECMPVDCLMRYAARHANEPLILVHFTSLRY